MSIDAMVNVLEPCYGGLSKTSDSAVHLPFVIRDEAVEISEEGHLARIVKQASERVQPHCRHFMQCGGCQYQMMNATHQGELKVGILRGLFAEASFELPQDIPVHTGPGYGYRNRIRLRVERVVGQLKFGYNKRTTTEFLPIVECPIAASVLWQCAETLLDLVTSDVDVAFWLDAASEIELFADGTMAKVQVTLLCAPRTKAKQGSIERCFAALRRAMPEIIGMGAIASDPRTGPTGRTIAEAGAAGLNYRVLEETYWVARGGFFQVNRFLLGDLVKLVCETDGDARQGDVAWDLFAGVGLFSRVLARTFARVVAVEANAAATANNAAALRKLSASHEAINATTLEFLKRATLQRERPQLIVLDPPRAGAGIEVCELLLQFGAPQMVYVSCDPMTLVRDLKVLARDYAIQSLRVIDLFPQTFHLETIVVLERRK